MALWHLKGSLDETGAVKEIPITRFPFIIGRSKSIDMVVLRSGISREHAEIISRDGRLFLRDLQSTNGTFVNKQRINSEVLLTHETMLHFAQFEFTLIDSEHKSSDDEMLTVVVNVDEALGLHENLANNNKEKTSQPRTEKPAKREAFEINEGSANQVVAEPSNLSLLDKPSPAHLSKPQAPDNESIPGGQYGDDKVFIQGNWDDSNRRMHSRREARWPAEVTLKNQQTFQCVTKDISEFGLALKSPVNLPVKDLIKVNIKSFYKGKSREITALGVVKHSLITTGGFIVGVQIKNCASNNSEFIAKFSSRKI